MKTSIKFLLIAIIVVFNLSCNNAQQLKEKSKSGEITVITPEVYKNKSMNQTIIDVRTPEEFAEGHLIGAVNINFKSDDFLEEIAKQDKNKPIFVYCRSGRRSAAASTQMSELGFKEIYDIKGGILNWTKNNYPIVK